MKSLFTAFSFVETKSLPGTFSANSLFLFLLVLLLLFYFLFNTPGNIGPGVKNKEKIKSKCEMTKGPDRRAKKARCK